MDGSYQILGGIKCEEGVITAILAVPTSQVSEGTPPAGERADKVAPPVQALGPHR
jgi:hypothetical protein